MTGHAFEGWQVNNEPVDHLQVPLNGVTVTAVYRPYKTIQTIYMPGASHRISLTTDEMFQGPELDVPEPLLFLGYFPQPFGLGEQLRPDMIIENGRDMRVYPYVLNPVTVQNPSLNTLALNAPYGRSSNQDSTADSVIVPWASIAWWSLTFVGLVIAAERKRRHG